MNPGLVRNDATLFTVSTDKSGGKRPNGWMVRGYWWLEGLTPRSQV